MAKEPCKKAGGVPGNLFNSPSCWCELLQQITHATSLICKRQQRKTYTERKMSVEQRNSLYTEIYETWRK